MFGKKKTESNAEIKPNIKLKKTTQVTVSAVNDEFEIIKEEDNWICIKKQLSREIDLRIYELESLKSLYALIGAVINELEKEDVINS